MLRRFLPTLGVLVAVTAPLAAANISGTVFDDPRALATRSDFRPLSGVTVTLYRDGGDHRADGADDSMMRTTTTASDGTYAFQALADASYWIVVDSRSAGIARGTWPQQTYGAPGSLCDDGTGAARTITKGGPCYGGRLATRSDDARSLAAANHVAEVSVTGVDAPGVDFAFSDNVVTSAADSGQGTLRQFVINANASRGANEMRFVPVAADSGARTTIRLTTPLPDLTGGGTAVDGTVYSFTTGKMAGTGASEVQSAPTESGRPRPHIALDVEATGEVAFNFVAPGTVRAIGIRGGRTALRTTSDLFVDRVEIGGAAHEGAPADWGVVVTGGNAILRQVTILDRVRNGMLAEAKGIIDAADVEVTHCASTTSSAVALRSGGSTLAHCEVIANNGIGIEIGSTTAADGPARGNAIRTSHVVDNAIAIVLHPNASDTVIEYNDIVWNRAAGIVAESGGGGRRARVSMNHFNENGGAVIGVGEQTDFDAPVVCTTDTFGTVSAPQVTRTETKGVAGAGEITIEGNACPGASVEVYTSYVTAELRRHSQENPQDLTSVREALKRNAVESRDPGGLTAMKLPSVGEFNFAGSARADAGGRFLVTVPWPRQVGASLAGDLRAGALSVAAIEIDVDGNTSRFGRRKIVTKP